MKRAFDFLCALAGLLLLSPILLLSAGAVFLEDRHSPFYLGVRIGRFGAPFRMVKFRSMIPDAWKSGVSSTSAGDRRITRTGALLRAAKLDELPQLWNVLVGQMSLVGPRPQVATDAAMYTDEERRMLDARPGITDLASIVFADEGQILAGADDPDLLYNQIIRPWKSRLALLYLEHQSLATDLRIIALTLLSGISRQRSLNAVETMLLEWEADPLLVLMSRREHRLQPWPPPGARQIVSQYPVDAEATTPTIPTRPQPRRATAQV